MKIYMAYSRYAGSAQGAFLVFAHSVKEAKEVAWPEAKDVLVDGCDYIDLAIRLVKGNEDHLFKHADREKLDKGIAHVVDNPPSCQICLMWDSKVGDDGLCFSCRQNHIEYISMSGLARLR